MGKATAIIFGIVFIVGIVGPAVSIYGIKIGLNEFINQKKHRLHGAFVITVFTIMLVACLYFLYYILNLIF